MLGNAEKGVVGCEVDEERCGERCLEVWGFGKVQGVWGNVERGVGKCLWCRGGEMWRKVLGVWENVGECVGMWGEVREDEGRGLEDVGKCYGRYQKVWGSVLGCGGGEKR